MKLSLKTCEKIQANINVYFHNEIHFKFSVKGSEILFSAEIIPLPSQTLNSYDEHMIYFYLSIHLSIYSSIHWSICIWFHPQRFWLLNSVVYNRSKMPASMILSKSTFTQWKNKKLEMKNVNCKNFAFLYSDSCCVIQLVDFQGSTIMDLWSCKEHFGCPWWFVQ